MLAGVRGMDAEAGTETTETSDRGGIARRATRRRLGAHMVGLVGFVALVAGGCEHRPPPRERATAQSPSTASVAPSAPAAAQAPVVPEGEDQVSERCLMVATHIADVQIADAQAPAQKAAYTQNRAQLIRRSAERCTKLGWSDAQIACYQGASSLAALQACNQPPS